MNKIIFLQLPLLDNDLTSHMENSPLAAQYLTAAAEKSGECRHFDLMPPDSDFNRLDNRHTNEKIIRLQPRAVAATLYLWNVERTIRVLRQIKRRLPNTVVMVGGPEVVHDHPFLFKSLVPDVAVCGEGEPVFPSILQAFRKGTQTDFSNVAWRSGSRYIWGSAPAPEPALQTLLPPPLHPANRPDSNGMAYMETVRGCPFRCAFCRYGQQRRKVSRMPVNDIIARIRILRKRGAKEIRFIDPTFNARPDFPVLISRIAAVNRKKDLTFFAELEGGSITPASAAMLAKANINQVEVGVQSTSPAVLRAVRRSTRTDKVMQGIDLLAANGINTTLDVMCGLPEQTTTDVRSTLTRLMAVPGSHVQLLHTLLIPGSPLRGAGKKLGLRSQPRPPYRVTSTRTMPGSDMLEMDEFAARLLRARLDSPAGRFVAQRLPELFHERITIDLSTRDKAAPVLSGMHNRRVLVFSDTNLYGQRGRILAVMRKALQSEPDILWQFVLKPYTEEPLDLIDRMIEEIDLAPGHFADRLHVRRKGTSRTARRIFIQLHPRTHYDPAWKAEAESLLGANFY